MTRRERMQGGLPLPRKTWQWVTPAPPQTNIEGPIYIFYSKCWFQVHGVIWVTNHTWTSCHSNPSPYGRTKWMGGSEKIQFFRDNTFSSFVSQPFVILTHSYMLLCAKVLATLWRRCFRAVSSIGMEFTFMQSLALEVLWSPLPLWNVEQSVSHTLNYKQNTDLMRTKLQTS